MSRYKAGYESSAPVSKMLPASNIYRVGDYVYVETQPSHPYQIRRIEELTKTANGQVEAKVSCFYRRRDLSNALVSQADKHAITAEEDEEIYIGEDQTDEKLHQLKHREVFLSRQLEIINANTIRGKCSVTLYSEIEKLYDYLEKEDWFYYLLVYDPQQKTLLADRGEIGIGDEYQCDVPELLMDPAKDDGRKTDCSDLETLVWNPENGLHDKNIDNFLVLARSIGTFARALDCGSAVREPSLHLSAAAASRDITLFHAMNVLHKNGYDMGKAVSGFVSDEGPVLCRDEMEEWSSGESSLFEEAVKKFGKEFTDIQQEYLPWKKMASLVEYYYMWKTTDKYVQQKRLKAAEGDSKVTQIFIPSSNTAVNLTLAVQATSQYQVTAGGNFVTPNYICESCFGKESALWYPWGPSTSQCKLFLCKECWLYWKKYGGLKKTAKSTNPSPLAEAVYKCRICNKKFNRAERLSNHMAAHKGLKCTFPGCEKSFSLKAHLSRHLAMQHSMFNEAKKLKVKTPFAMTSTDFAKVCRFICRSHTRWHHFARNPTDCVNQADVRAECGKVLTPELAKDLFDKKTEKKKPLKRKSLDDVIQVMKKIQKTTGINVQRPHIISSMQQAKDSNPGSSGMRKLMSPTKTSVSMFGQTQTSMSGHLKGRTLRSPRTNSPVSTGYKRPLDVALEQNGIDDSAPSSKRHNTVGSPVNRNGFDCHVCGKIFHSQVNLSHHVQLHGKGSTHSVISQAADANRSNSNSPYYDGNSGTPTPNSHHSIIHQPVNKTQKEPITNGARQHVPQGKAPGPQKVGRGFSTMTPQKRPTARNASEFTGKEGDPHYVDPPQEFFFKSTKEANLKS
ncbi:metastasis-associated protein MTA3-like isoform X3 [Rhopilema esculentum]|uniref:metastasis-associated protein MTA3-like isoform X3 n=1 Tax=Rhopilema esculentum TaxID=499914 RepID=UPI0031DCBD23